MSTVVLIIVGLWLAGFAFFVGVGWHSAKYDEDGCAVWHEDTH